MTLTQRLAELIAAGFTGIWIPSHEHDEAAAEIAGLCKERNWRMAFWDVDRGLQVGSGDAPTAPGGSDPLAAIRALNVLAAPGLVAQTLKKNGLLTLHRGRETFADLGGLDALKQFCHKALRPGAKDRPARPRGVLLLGVPGRGKSCFAKALGNEIGRPTLLLDVGTLLGGLVGATESNTRQALRTIDAMAPCVVHLDEIEKSPAGAAGGNGDSGVSARMMAALLGRLSDHESDVFVTASANDISRLPPELSRAERWDRVWFLDVPSSAEKAAIWSLYLSKFGLDPAQPKPADTTFTGAEIKSCCRLAALLDIPLVEAARNVVPVAVTAAESVERLRNWASGRGLSAYKPGLYLRESATVAEKTARKVSRPSSN